MKKIPLATVVACLLALTACKKQEPTKTSTRDYDGVQMDWTKLNTEFTASEPDVQQSVSMLNRCFRYGQFPQALSELEKLSQQPTLTEPQKEVVNDLIEQTKQAIAKTPPVSGK